MIHRFCIENFKSIVRADVELSPVTVLVGRSGAGKSNFVHGIRFLRDLLSTPPQRAQTRSEWGQIRHALHLSSPVHIEVEFSVNGIESPFTYKLSIAPSPYLELIEESLTLGQQCLFHQKGSKKVAPRQPQPEWIRPPDLINVPPPGEIAIGRLSAISDIVVAFTALTVGIGCYTFPDNVLCNRERNQTQPAWVGLDDGATNYLGVVRNIASDLQDLKVRREIIHALQHLNQSVSSIELDDLWEPTSVMVGHKLDGKTLSLELSQESDGFRRFYAHMLALFQRPPKQTLVFEHPEDGIHPGALSLLADEFRAAPSNRRGQVILTTHSPRFLDHFEVEQIRVVDLQDYATQIGRISHEQQESIQEQLLSAGELLTVDPARIDQNPQSEATGA